MDVTFDHLSRGVWDEAEAQRYLQLLLQALAHARKIRAMFMDVLLTHDDQQDEYDKLEALIKDTLAKREITPKQLREIYQRSLYQPNLENSLVMFGRLGFLAPQPGWEASWQGGRKSRADPELN